MKLAVCYDNGEIFQHFGRTESFKLYDIEDGKVVSSRVVGTDGIGHEALAELLADYDISVLICGGMGEGAQMALLDAGIAVFSGVTGSADEAVEAFLRGELVSEGVNCHEHDHEHEHEDGCDCGCEDDGCGCEGGCAGCGGGCGEIHLTMEGKNAGKRCRVHYKGTFNDGTQFDSSYDRNEPLEFICAAGMMIRGFDAAVVNMEVGDTADIHLMPEEAYGMPDPNAIFTVEIALVPGSENLSVGEMVYLANEMGQPFPVTVTAKDEKNITFDANHEMAGKELNFHIELVSVEE